MATVLITGANRGIGLALCREYKRRGDAVIAVCRKSSRELDSVGVNVQQVVDVTSDGDIAGLAQRLKGLQLDILINNAGLFSEEFIGKMDFERIRRQLEVNSLGPLRVTLALLASLGPGSKVAIITSQMGSMEETTSGGYYGYRMSKAAVNIAGKALACDLRERGIAVVLLHPGYVRTDMTKHQGKIDPDESARGLAARISELTLETSGGFFHANGRPVAW